MNVEIPRGLAWVIIVILVVISSIFLHLIALMSLTKQTALHIRPM